jgi:putative membrane protein
MQEIAPMEPGQLPALVGVLLVSIGISGLLLSRATARAGSLQGLGSSEVGLGILAYLICAVAIISGAEGMLIFATATAVGLLPPLLGVRRTHVMGLIIVPSIMLSL